MPEETPVNIRRGDEVTLDIESLAFGGRGIARVDGLTVFVEGALPGDSVRARIIRKKQRYAEARLMEIILPAPDRTEPPCRYFGYCGGCVLQNLAYDRQLEYKRQHVVDSLEHIALMPDVRVHPVLPSARLFGYRNKMEFSCSDRRWLLPVEMGREDLDTGFALGLHVPGTFNKILDIEQCLLFPDDGNRILAAVRELIRQSSVPVYNLKTHAGFWRFVMLRHSVAADTWMVNIVTAFEDRPRVQPLADMIAGSFPKVSSVMNNINGRKAAIAAGEREILLYGDAVIEDRIGRFRFDISANSFFQTNTPGAEALYRVAESYAALSGTETVMDLYCGTGTIAIRLSGAAREVVGLEINPACVADADANCRKNGIDNARFIAGDVRETLNRIGQPPDVLVIDPPRAGMHPDVVAQVLGLATPKIVYVSCNPATLARDIGLLKEHYTVAEVQPVDMFPHTPHIECVARLIHKKDGS
ncbi:MAG: 23S rRNA (uracil(1939)-C(5))-methyltransferase RlmD [Thermodesulfobacteriota bacterium]